MDTSVRVRPIVGVSCKDTGIAYCRACSLDVFGVETPGKLVYKLAAAKYHDAGIRPAYADDCAHLQHVDCAECGHPILTQ